MRIEEAVERAHDALADLPSGPSADETLALIQYAAWDEGYMACLLQVQAGMPARNPYRAAK